MICYEFFQILCLKIFSQKFEAGDVLSGVLIFVAISASMFSFKRSKYKKKCSTFNLILIGGEPGKQMYIYRYFEIQAMPASQWASPAHRNRWGMREKFEQIRYFQSFSWHSFDVFIKTSWVVLAPVTGRVMSLVLMLKIIHWQLTKISFAYCRLNADFFSETKKHELETVLLADNVKTDLLLYQKIIEILST